MKAYFYRSLQYYVYKFLEDMIIINGDRCLYIVEYLVHILYLPSTFYNIQTIDKFVS
jgi:hypothetical protein